MSPEDERKYVVDTIRDFLAGTGGDWDWDDFISCPIPYPELDDVRRFCSGLPYEYPSPNKREYCSEMGLQALRRKLSELTAGDH